MAKSLILFYDFMEEKYDWKNGRIPMFIGRIEVAAQDALNSIGNIIKAVDIPDTKMVVVLEDTGTNMGAIQDLYAAFAEKYNCYIEWDVENLDIALMDDEDEEDPQSNVFLVVFYGPPLLSRKVDSNVEPPLAMFVVEDMVNSHILCEMTDILIQNGLIPAEWHIHPYSEELFESITSKSEEFITKTNECLNCLMINKGNTSRCKSCGNFQILTFAAGLFFNGITEISFDSDEIRFEEGKE